MPLTEKGKDIMKSMQRTYGGKKGEQVFYATANAGKISGVEEKAKGGKVGKTRKSSKPKAKSCLLYTSPSPRDGLLSRMPSSA